MTPDGDLPPLETLYAAAPCGLLLTDADGTIRHANDTFCQWIGHTAAELSGITRFQDLLTVGGRIFHQTHWMPLLSMQGELREVKLELKNRDGARFPVVMNAVAREHAGRMFHELALFIAQDRDRFERELMRERERAEQLLATQMAAQQALELADARLRVALESAQLHVWHVDAELLERRYDDAVAELLGLPAPQPISAERFLAHIDAADCAAEAQAFADAMDAKKGSYRCVFRIRGADGAQRVVRGSGDGVFDAEGRFVRLVGVLQDVTELSQQRAAAEDRARFAEQMIGIVSHDLRNPLTAIKMGTHMARAEGLADDRRVRLNEHIDASIDRARRLVEDLLDFTQAKIGSGLSVTPVAMDIHETMAVAVDELSLSFPGRSLIHVRQGAGECRADPLRLTQLLGNLVGNAMAYGAPGKAVTVTSSIRNGSFTLDVHNWGTPIPAALLPVLFEPMNRGTAIGAEQRSVGLGLFIVKDIVRAHGGKVVVRSSEDEGTSFVASFPCSTGTAANAAGDSTGSAG